MIPLIHKGAVVESPRHLRFLAAATAAVLAVIAISKASFVGAIVFYVLALVYLVGAAFLLARPGRAALVSMALADLIWIGAEGRVLLDGVPTEPLADLFVVAVGVPFAVINLALAVVIWARRSTTTGVGIDETPHAPA